MDMEKQTVVRDILGVALIDGSEEAKIRCYAAMIALRSIMRESSWKYPAAAWKYNVDTISKRVGGAVFNNGFLESHDFRNQFNVLYEVLSGVEAECIRRSPAAAGAGVTGSSAVTAAAV